MSVGRNIKRIRKASGMEQKDLAELLGVSNKTVSSWECDRTEPKIGMIEKMSKIFNCPKTDFIDEVDYLYMAHINDTLEPNIIEIEHKRSFETDLVEAFRAAPAGIKDSVRKLLDLDKED